MPALIQVKRALISVSDKMDRWERDGVPAADSQRAVSG